MTIPASQLVTVQPAVLSPGGSAKNLVGLLLTQNTRVPIGTYISLPTLAAVGTYFGATSQEYAYAVSYFAGFDNSVLKPAALLFAQFPTQNVAAYLQGTSVAGVPLATLRTYSGTLIVTIDGGTFTTSTINLAPATSLSNAATIIQTALGSATPPGASFTGSISGTTLTVSAVGSGTLQIGEVVAGGTVASGTVILAQLTGTTGGIGTYTVSQTQTVSSGALTAAYAAPAVAYDTISGAFIVTSGTTGATSSMSQATGSLAANVGLAAGTLSQGAVPAVPASFMNALVVQTANWATFTTLWLPTTTLALGFAAWNSSQNSQFAYVLWDNATNSPSAIQSNDTASLGYQIKNAAYGGVIPVWSPVNGALNAAFISGAIASINFTQNNGRTTMAYRTQTGLAPDTTDPTQAANLTANGYNFYGSYATASQSFNLVQPGSISGSFLWVDSYVNQIWLNGSLQAALLALFQSVGSVPYNPFGYSQIAAACQTPINAAINFGAIRTNVTLSSSEITAINNTAQGVNAAAAVSSNGYYLLISDPGPVARAQRQTPSCTFWYADGQSVQKIVLASVDVQ